LDEPEETGKQGRRKGFAPCDLCGKKVGARNHLTAVEEIETGRIYELCDPHATAIGKLKGYRYLNRPPNIRVDQEPGPRM
jgi:hypothetical protein